MNLNVDNARSFCIEAFQAVGCSLEDAQIVSDVLVDANIHGVNTHGISRLPIYIKRIREGRINPSPNISFEKKGSVLIVDGKNGIGQVVTVKAINEALKYLDEYGTLSVAIRNSNHFGHAFYYCKQIVQHKAFCMMTTNSPKGIAPWGGREAYFGTNPIAFGFPAKDNPVIVDMSSSLVARGNIILAAQNNESIPEGWAIDEDGKPTTDPKAAMKGAVLPFGGAKGYALALSLEILAGILTGANFGSNVQSIYNDNHKKANVGHFIFLSSIKHYMEEQTYLDRIEQMITEIKETPLAEGFHEISIPGERKKAKAEITNNQGIQLSNQVSEELAVLSTELGISTPSFEE